MNKIKTATKVATTTTNLAPRSSSGHFLTKEGGKEVLTAKNHRTLEFRGVEVVENVIQLNYNPFTKGFFESLD